jgi:hypothetical protein
MPWSGTLHHFYTKDAGSQFLQEQEEEEEEEVVVVVVVATVIVEEMLKISPLCF